MTTIRTKMICAGCYRYDLVREGEVIDTAHVERGMDAGPTYWTVSFADEVFGSKAEARDYAITVMQDSACFTSTPAQET